MSGVVCNASPLIVLAKAERLDVLPRLFAPVCLPQSVETEIACGPADDPMRLRLQSTAWLKRVRIEPPLSPLAGWQLGLGESEVIEFARRKPDLGVVLDDRAARRAAFALDLTVYGTLSVLALARKRGIIVSFRDAAADVVNAGLYASPTLLDAIALELNE